MAKGLAGYGQQEGFRFKWSPDPRKAAEAFDRLSEGVRDARPVFRKLQVKLYLQKIFAGQGAALGATWAPHSPHYLPERRGPGVLNRTGDLLRRVMSARITKKPLRLRAFLRVKHGASLHWGYKARNLPPRPFFAISEEMENRFFALFKEHLDKRIAAASTGPRRILGS